MTVSYYFSALKYYRNLHHQFLDNLSYNLRDTDRQMMSMFRIPFCLQIILGLGALFTAARQRLTLKVDTRIAYGAVTVACTAALYMIHRKWEKNPIDIVAMTVNELARIYNIDVLDFIKTRSIGKVILSAPITLVQRQGEYEGVYLHPKGSYCSHCDFRLNKKNGQLGQWELRLAIPEVSNADKMVRNVNENLFPGGNNDYTVEKDAGIICEGGWTGLKFTANVDWEGENTQEAMLLHFISRLCAHISVDEMHLYRTSL